MSLKCESGEVIGELRLFCKMLLMVVRKRDGLGAGRFLRFLYRPWHADLAGRDIQKIVPDKSFKTANSQHPAEPDTSIVVRFHPVSRASCHRPFVLDAGVRPADQWRPPESHQSASQPSGGWHDFEVEGRRCGATSLRSAGTGGSHDWPDVRAWHPVLFLPGTSGHGLIGSWAAQ